MDTNRLKQLADDWDLVSVHDPMFSIASMPDRNVNGAIPWDSKSFFEIGQKEFDHFLAYWKYQPTGHDRVLDIGCGLGRLSRPMAARFGEVHGVDISEVMVTKAREYHSGVSNLSFHVGPGDGFPMFPDGWFDAVFSYIVFQHMPLPAVLRYIAEVRRVLRPGGQAFLHLPLSPDANTDGDSSLSLLQWARQLSHRVLRRAGMKQVALRFWNPVTTAYFPESPILEACRGCGLQLTAIRDVPPLVTDGIRHAAAQFYLFN